MLTRADTLWFEPRLPRGLPAARFTLLFRGQQVTVSLTARRLEATLAPGAAAPVRIGVDGVAQTVKAAQTLAFPIPPPAPAAVNGLPRPAA